MTQSHYALLLLHFHSPVQILPPYTQENQVHRHLLSTLLLNLLQHHKQADAYV